MKIWASHSHCAHTVNLSKDPGLIFISAEYRQPRLKPKGAVSFSIQGNEAEPSKSPLLRNCGTTESASSDLLAVAGSWAGHGAGAGDAPGAGRTVPRSESGDNAKLVNPIPRSILGKGLLSKGGFVGVWGFVVGPHRLRSREGCCQANTMEVLPMSKKENASLQVCLALYCVQANPTTQVFLSYLQASLTLLPARRADGCFV